MACCLTAPSHYLNQCWLIIRSSGIHLPPFTEIGLKITYLKLKWNLPGGQWVNYTVHPKNHTWFMFIVLCSGLVSINCTHYLQGYFTGTGASETTLKDMGEWGITLGMDSANKRWHYNMYNVKLYLTGWTHTPTILPESIKSTESENQCRVFELWSSVIKVACPHVSNLKS